MTDDEQSEALQPASVRLASEIRRRRTEVGLSQPQLAQRIGYTRQYVSLAERPDHNLPSRDLVRALDHALDANGALMALRDEGRREQRQLHQRVTPEAALMALDAFVDVPKSRPGALRYVTALVTRLHSTYQAARYDEVGRALPEVMRKVDYLLPGSGREDRRQTLRVKCEAAIVEAKLATKLGDGATAYAAAERALDLAEQAEDPVGRAAASYQLTCALLRLGDAEEAERNAVESAEKVDQNDPASLSMRGSLTLISAIIAARRKETAEAERRLGHAEQLAERLGRDANIGFSAFGPSNVQIHRMSAAVALDDPHSVLTLGERLDLTAMPPGLYGRQGQVNLDSAWACAQLGADLLAVIYLLEADRVASELLKGSRTARTVVGQLLARERRHATPGLRGLAQRIGVI